MMNIYILFVNTATICNVNQNQDDPHLPHSWNNEREMWFGKGTKKVREQDFVIVLGTRQLLSGVE